MCCLSENGVHDIKETLKLAISEKIEGIELSIYIPSPPNYKIIAKCKDRKKALETIENILKIIEENIKKCNGHFKILNEPFLECEQEIRLMSLNTSLERFKNRY